jgi:hypothetical protein
MSRLLPQAAFLAMRAAVDDKLEAQARAAGAVFRAGEDDATQAESVAARLDYEHAVEAAQEAVRAAADVLGADVVSAWLRSAGETKLAQITLKPTVTGPRAPRSTRLAPWRRSGTSNTRRARR